MKGYWVARVTIKNQDRYKDYLALNKIAFDNYGGRFIVRGGESMVAATGAPANRVIVLEFASYAQAKACFASTEYQTAYKVLRESADADLVIVEGYDG